MLTATRTVATADGALMLDILDNVIERHIATNDGEVVVKTMSRRSVLVVFNYSAITNVSQMANGQVRLNAGHPFVNATKLWVANIDAGGMDIQSGLLLVAMGSIVLIQQKNDHGKFVRFTTTAPPSPKGSYVEYAVKFQNRSGGQITDGTQVMIQSTGVSSQPIANATDALLDLLVSKKLITQKEADLVLASVDEP